MKTLTKRLISLVQPTDDRHTTGKSWSDRFTGEQRLRANTALSSLEMSVFMGDDDDKAVAVAKLLLRGVNRSSWAS